MSKSELQKFYIEQIETTKDMVKTFADNEKFSQTLILNSLLSLVVLPVEKAKKNDGKKIFPGSYKELEKKLGFAPTIFTPINTCKDGNIKIEKKTIYAYIRKFRNGIAHQNLEINVHDDRSVSVIIYNKFRSVDCKKCSNKFCEQKGLIYNPQGIVDYKTEVSILQLQKLAMYIADSYLKAMK